MQDELLPDKLDLFDPGRRDSTTLRATELADRILYVPLGGDEYYLIENRETDLNGDNTVYLDRDSTTNVILGPGLSSADLSDSLGDKEYDFLLPGQGILVWHIDDTVIFGVNIPPDGGINSNPERRGVAVVEADGIGHRRSQFALVLRRPLRSVLRGEPHPARARHQPLDRHERRGAEPRRDQRGLARRRRHGDRDPLRLARGGLARVHAIRTERRSSHVRQPAPRREPERRGFGRQRHPGLDVERREPFYTANDDGRFALLPAPSRVPVPPGDSLFRSNPLSLHGAARRGHR